jgi:hypothetical protein
MKTGLFDMNQFEPEANGALVNSTPLFASSLLALFYVLRKNFTEHRMAENPTEKTSQAEEK